MPDFNTKKEILRRLRAKKERNKALWLPCTAAELCVKAWYAVICHAGLALSDKNGRFLGVGTSEDKPKARRQDDIVYVRKPLLGRVLSAILAFSLIMMFVPELFPGADFGIVAEAADANAYVEIDGEKYYYYVGDTTKAFHESDYLNAYQYSVTIDSVEKGYANMRLNWTAPSKAYTDFNNQPVDVKDKISGYRISVLQNGKEIDYENVQSSSDKVTDHVFRGAKGTITGSDSYTVRITPQINAPAWTLEYDKDNPDNPPKASPPTNGETLPITSFNYGSYEVGKLDVTLSMPEFKVYDANGDECPNPAEFAVGKSAKLVWNPSLQSDDSSKQADYYTIYRYDVTANKFYKYENVKTTSYTLSQLTPGTHYEFFIEAGKQLWDGKEGLISSSGVYYADSDINKRNGIYSDHIKELYIAPASPNLEASADTKNHLINLKWSFKGNSDGIILVRSDNIIPDSDWQGNFNSLSEYIIDFAVNGKTIPGLKKITPQNSAATACSDSDIVVGKDYYYYAVSFIKRDDNDSVIYSSCTPPQPSNMDIQIKSPQDITTERADGQITVSWASVKGADGYLLTITKNKDNQGNPVNETILEPYDLSTTSYTHKTFNGKKLLNGEEYTYSVQAYVNVKTATSNTLISSPPISATDTVGTPLNVPQDLKLTTTDGTINVSWTALRGAEGYILHYKYVKADGSSSDYTSRNVFDVAKTSYVHSGLNNGDKYTYYVEAYKTVNGVRVYSDPSDEAWIIVGVPLDAPKDFKGTTSDGRVDLTWSAVSGAQGYILHIVSSNGSEQTIDLSKPGFQHTGLNNGDVYTYYVQAYKTVNGIRVYSDGSTTSANRVTFTVGDTLDSPKDFNAVTTDGQVDLSWTAVKGAEGYVLYAYGNGRSYQFDLSKTRYQHTGLQNGDRWTYYLAAYKTVNGKRFYSSPTRSITVDIGVSLNAAIDLIATAGNRQVDLSWSAVKGAEGYVVYLYNTKTMEFEPITVVSGTKYSHTGLKNGKKYTYMVAPFKTVNGERRYGEYSMSVDAIPSTGSNTDIDHSLNVRGTTPYGISHSEYISAAANHGAFDESVDVYFSTNKESTEAVKDVLKNYADGLKSFIIYPFDISIYEEGTLVEIDPYDGYSVTVTMPIPDRLIAYRDYITVVHIGERYETEEGTDEIGVTDVSADDWISTASGSLEVLPSAVVDIDNVWCIQFVCSSFSPYAFVIYKEHILDVSAGGGVIASSFADSFNSGLLLFTAFPDILPNNKKLKVVVGGRKRYRIKSIEKVRR